jgi:hypothetical protein
VKSSVQICKIKLVAIVVMLILNCCIFVGYKLVMWICGDFVVYLKRDTNVVKMWFTCCHLLPNMNKGMLTN